MQHSLGNKLKRRYITLVELLVVMALLISAIGVIGININKALREQHFKTEVDLVTDMLVLAQNLMLIMNADTHVVFQTAKDQQSIQMQMHVDGNEGSRLIKLVTEKIKDLKYVHYVQFKDENKTHNESEKVDVKFISKGSVMSKGLMRLSTHKSSNESGVLERYICLPGYAKPIYSTNKKNDDPACLEGQDNDFSQRFINFTVNEIHAKQNVQTPTHPAP